jgi:hypothetical protein
MYLTHYAEDGTIKGFYVRSLHHDIPSPVLEITAEQHADYFARGQRHKIIDGEFVYVEPEPQSPEVVTPEVNQDVADLWQAMLAMSSELEALKGGQ